METVTLKPLHHRGAECIGIYALNCRLENGKPLNYYFQTKAGAKWSKTNQCWYMPCTEKHYDELVKALKGLVFLEVSGLKKYLTERKENKGAQKFYRHNLPVAQEEDKKSAVPFQQFNKRTKLSDQNNDALQNYKQHLVLKGYSVS